MSGKPNGLNVPADKNANHIADAWEKAIGVDDKPANWDEDPKPAGQARNGDGYTLFEEYRGFVEILGGQKSYARFDPFTKDVFVYDPEGLHQKYYWPENPSKLRWHYVDQTMMPFSTALIDPNSRWMNSNTGENTDRFYARQYAIRVKSNQTPVDYAGTSLSINDVRASHGKPPIEGYSWMPACKNAQSAEIETGSITAAYQSIKSTPLRTRIVENQLKITAIHEIGHMLEVIHHTPESAAPPARCATTPTRRRKTSWRCRRKATPTAIAASS